MAGGGGAPSLTLESVNLRSNNSPAGALWAKEGSISRKTLSALLVFNHRPADQEGISYPWPSSPLEIPPNPSKNHFPGLLASPAAGGTLHEAPQGRGRHMALGTHIPVATWSSNLVWLAPLHRNLTPVF